MSKKKPKMLSDFETDEVSLVTKGANKKKFFITKQEDQVSKELDHEQILKSVELKREDAQKQVEEVFKETDINNAGMEGLQSAIAILQSIRSSLPKGINIKISDDSDKYDGVALCIRKEESMPDEHEVSEKGKKKKKKSPSMDLGDMKVKKAEDFLQFIEKAEGLENEEKQSLTQILKESAMSDQKETIEKAEAEKIQKENADLKLENSALTDRIEKLEKSEKANRIEKAMGQFPNLDQESVKKSLTDALEAGEAVFETVEKAFISAQEVAVSAGPNGESITKELGSSEEGGPADPVDAIAEEIRKADPSLTFEQAYSKALLENPEHFEVGEG